MNKIKVVYPEFEINTTPLEEIIIDPYSLQIILDDISEERYVLYTEPYQAFKITTIDCASALDYYNDYCYRDGRYHRHILQIENSDYISELRKAAPSADFLNDSKHFALLLQDNLIDIISYELVISKKI